MSLTKRLSLILKAKAHKRLDAMENVSDSLDYSYARQLTLLTKVRRGLVEVSTARKRIEAQANALANRADTLTRQAQQAIELGREDLAREALTRKSALVPQLRDLAEQRDSLLSEEEKLAGVLGRLEQKVAAFRVQKETLKAKHAAAVTHARIGESLAGISGDIADAGRALARAEDQTLQMQACAGAVDELLASGALDSPLGPADPLSRELDAVTAAVDVDSEVARLKAMFASARDQRKELDG